MNLNVSRERASIDQPQGLLLFFFLVGPEYAATSMLNFHSFFGGGEGAKMARVVMKCDPGKKWEIKEAGNRLCPS